MQIPISPNAIPGLSSRPTSRPRNLLGDTLWVGINGEVRCARHAGYSLLSAASYAPLAVEHYTDNNHWIRVDVMGAQASDWECEVCRSTTRD